MRAALVVALAALALIGAAPPGSNLRTAVFAGGCFWSVEHDMEGVAGVRDVVVGYAGGRALNPTYEDHDGHLEAVRVTYDPARISYPALVEAFFRRIDPTDPAGQICDYGPSYRTAVFVADPAERAAAEGVKARVAGLLRKPVATEIRPSARFWPAEAYHQDFAHRNPARYGAYRSGCGRDARLRAVWAGR